MCLNHPETTPPHPPPPRSVEKLSSMKPVPDTKKVGDRCRKLTQFCKSAPANRSFTKLVVRQLFPSTKYTF